MTESDLQPAPSRRWNRTAVIALLLMTFCVFGRCVTFDFLNWDDMDLVVQNPLLNRVTADHIATAWKEPVKKLYSPLAYTVWSGIAMVARLPTADEFGSQLNPMVFHALNVVLHAGCVLMVFAILRRLFDTLPPAIVGAAVFAFHPIQAEAVSWISGMNNLLAGFFSLVSIWAYIRFARGKNSIAWYAIAVIALALGLCSKPTAIVTPLMLFAIDVWFLRRSFANAAISSLPLLLVTIPFILVGRAAQADDVVIAPPFADRLRIMADTYGFYFTKVAWPHPLLFDYSRTPEWVIEHGVAMGSIVALSIAGLLVLAAVLSNQWRIVAAFAIFVAGILPVSGITPFTYQYYGTVADRYAYLSMFGMALLAAIVIARFSSRGALSFAAAIVVVLISVTFVQTGVWADTSTLANHALAYNARSFAAHDMLAQMAAAKRDFPQAEHEYLLALEIRPDEQFCNFNLGQLLAVNEKRPADAIPYLQRAIDAGYTTADAEYYIGYSRLILHQPAQAIAPLRSALQLNSQHVPSLTALGWALTDVGNLDEAEKSFQAALSIDPNFPLAKVGLNRLLAMRGQLPVN